MGRTGYRQSGVGVGVGVSGSSACPAHFFPPSPPTFPERRPEDRGSGWGSRVRVGVGVGVGVGVSSPHPPFPSPSPGPERWGWGWGWGSAYVRLEPEPQSCTLSRAVPPPPVHASRLLQQRLPIQSSFFFVCVRFTSPCRPFARLPGHSRTPDTACVSEKQRARAQLAVRDLELRPLLPSTTTRCARLPPLPAPSAAPRSAFSVHPWAASHTRAHPRPLGTSVQTRTSHQWANQNTGRFFLREKVHLCRISSESVLRSS